MGTRVRLAWGRLRMLGTMGVVLACMMCAAAAEPPGKPIPKALPVADDEPVTPTKRNQDPGAFTPFTRQAKGTNSKPASKTSVAPPVGRYSRLVTGEVEKKWRVYVHLRRNSLTLGELKLVFYVNKKGKIEGLRIIDDKKSNPILTEVTMKAIRDAEIPPIPADVIPFLPEEDGGRFKINYDVCIY